MQFKLLADVVDATELGIFAVSTSLGIQSTVVAFLFVRHVGLN